MSIHDVTNKVISRDSSYVVDVVMWLKFGNSIISLREVIIISILYRLARKTAFLRDGLGPSSIIWDFHQERTWNSTPVVKLRDLSGLISDTFQNNGRSNLRLKQQSIWLSSCLWLSSSSPLFLFCFLMLDKGHGAVYCIIEGGT